MAKRFKVIQENGVNKWVAKPIKKRVPSTAKVIKQYSMLELFDKEKCEGCTGEKLLACTRNCDIR